MMRNSCGSNVWRQIMDLRFDDVDDLVKTQDKETIREIADQLRTVAYVLLLRADGAQTAGAVFLRAGQSPLAGN